MTMLRARIRAQNKNGVQQRGRLWAWLLVVLYITIFFGERHCAGQKETDLCKNEDKYLSRFRVMPVY